MFKKPFVIGGLLIATFSAAHGQSSIENTVKPSMTQSQKEAFSSSVEKFNIESTMNILKDVEVKSIKAENLDEFLSKYDVSSSVKSLVYSYFNQGLKYSDYIKIDYGIYALTKKTGSANDSSVGNVVRSDHVCEYVISDYVCTSKQNSSCVQHDNGFC